MAGVARSTWHYRSKPRPRAQDPVPQSQRAYRRRISAQERAEIERRIIKGWETNLSVSESFANAWDEGVMLGSLRSWWRIAAQIADQSKRPASASKAHTRNPRPAPVLVATKPGHVWSWDITEVKSIFTRITYKVYSIIDIYSRKIVGYRIEEREVDQLAVDMFEQAIATYGAPEYVHADSGASMRSNALKEALSAHGVTMTHNRPYVSNDNPYSESSFRTLKYRPDYPGHFASLDQAREHIDRFVAWSNTSHHHSGIALFTPDQVHDGTWHQVYEGRADTLDEYYQRHPERFNAPPKVPTPADIVGINHKNNPDNNPETRKAA